MPDVFIPIAERTGSIFALGRWVLDEACRQIKAWRDQGIAPPLLAINVSAAELHDYAKFEQFLAESLKRWSVAPGDIELELTKSVLMETTQMHSDALARIKELGTSIAIDDFGTGYSSLAYLSAYPLSRLKIAQQFVVGIPDNAGDVAITRATLSLARELGVKIIAEGIETKAQLDFLVSAGCRWARAFASAGPCKPNARPNCCAGASSTRLSPAEKKCVKWRPDKAQGRREQPEAATTTAPENRRRPGFRARERRWRQLTAPADCDMFATLWLRLAPTR